MRSPFRLAGVARSAATGVFSATFAADLALVDAGLAVTFRPECGRADAIEVALDQVRAPEHRHFEPALSAWVRDHEAEVVDAVLRVSVRPRLTLQLRRDDLTVGSKSYVFYVADNRYVVQASSYEAAAQELVETLCAARHPVLREADEAPEFDAEVVRADDGRWLYEVEISWVGFDGRSA